MYTYIHYHDNIPSWDSRAVYMSVAFYSNDNIIFIKMFRTYCATSRWHPILSPSRLDSFFLLNRIMRKSKTISFSYSFENKKKRISITLSTMPSL